MQWSYLLIITTFRDLVNPPCVYRASAVLMKNLIAFRKGILPYQLDPFQQRVRVTIIDTGIDGTHPYIRHLYGQRQDQEAPNPQRTSEVKDQQEAKCQSPCDLHFRDFVEPGSIDPIDEDGHGTFIAGIIFQLAPDVELSVARIGRTRSSIMTDYEVDVKVKDVRDTLIRSEIVWGEI